MRALLYLLIMTLKNRILNLRKKPALLILYLIIIAVIIWVFISASLGPKTDLSPIHYSDVRILYAITAGVGILFLYSFVTTGLSTGSTLFNMADVGLLFVSPVSSKKILIYGLVKQLATTFFSAIFILYQVGNLRQSFGLSLRGIISIFIIYAVLIFFYQLLSIAIYIFSNGRGERKQFVRILLYAVLILVVVLVYTQHMKTGDDILTCILSLTTLKLFQFIPGFGWGVMFINASIESNYLYLAISLFLFLVSSILIILKFASGDGDYYEDVLQSTEANYQKLQAAKEGKAVGFKRKIKVKKERSGLQGGRGYTAIFYRHLLEMKRTSRFVFFDTFTLLAAVSAGVFCYFSKSDYSTYIVLGILIYLQFFMAALGKLKVELTKPYIYMIPETSFKKIFMASATSLIKPCFDAIIIFTIVCIVTQTSPLLNLFAALAYASTGAIFVGYTLLCQKVFGSQPNKLVQTILGMFLFFIVLAPGIGTSVAAILILPPAFTFLGTFPFTFCCLVVTSFIFAGCGNLLDKAEYTGI